MMKKMNTVMNMMKMKNIQINKIITIINQLLYILINKFKFCFFFIINNK